jgi:hypothetical protein
VAHDGEHGDGGGDEGGANGGDEATAATMIVRQPIALPALSCPKLRPVGMFRGLGMSQLRSVYRV